MLRYRFLALPRTKKIHKSTVKTRMMMWQYIYKVRRNNSLYMLAVLYPANRLWISLKAFCA